MSWTPFTLCRKRDQYTFSPKYLSVEDPNTTDGLTVHHVLAAAQSPQWYAWGPPNMQCRLCASCWIYWKKYGGLKTPTQLDGGARGGSVSPVPYTCIPSHMSLCLAYKGCSNIKLTSKWSTCVGVRSPWSHDTPGSPGHVAIYPQWGSGKTAGQKPPDVYPAHHQADPRCSASVRRHPAASARCTATLRFHQRKRCQGWV